VPLEASGALVMLLLTPRPRPRRRCALREDEDAQGNILLTALAFRGHIAEALELLDEIPEASQVSSAPASWTTPLTARFAHAVRQGRREDVCRGGS
jgi:hypothetical protein